MIASAESLMIEMGNEAKASRAPGMGGGSERKIGGVEWYVRTHGSSTLLWTRDGKRISRKNAVIQIAELLQKTEQEAPAPAGHGKVSRAQFATAMVKKARSINWLCIWPRTNDPMSRVHARANRDRYIALARKALQAP